MAYRLPEKGQNWEDLKATMTDYSARDADWRNGKTGLYVFYAGDDVLEVSKEAYTMFMSENGLGPVAFPSLKRMETEVIEMALGLLNAPEDGAGSITSGGTESLILAVKSARDFATSNGMDVRNAEVVVPYSAHLAFDKACHYLGLKLIRVPLKEGLSVDLGAMEAALSERTVLMAGSAPNFPFGIVDPITELAQMADARNIWFHVDACVGGFFAPFAVMNGVDLVPFDFSVPGVCSISSDLHKYGYCAKGASTLLHRDKSQLQYQIFDCDTWPSGRLTTPNIPGTRPGGAIASAWAVLNYLGVEGYREKVNMVTSTRQKIADAVSAIEGLHVWGDPRLAIISFGSDTLDINAVWSGMFERGWFIGLNKSPKGIHTMLTPKHESVVDQYIDDLESAVAEVKAGNAKGDGSNARYAG